MKEYTAEDLGLSEEEFELFTEATELTGTLLAFVINMAGIIIPLWAIVKITKWLTKK